jgi:hypothetical protein
MGIVGQEMSFIKTYDQEIYDVKVQGDSIKIKAWIIFSLLFDF